MSDGTVIIEGPEFIRGDRVTKLRRVDGSEFYVIVPLMGTEEDGVRTLHGWIREDTAQARRARLRLLAIAS